MVITAVLLIRYKTFYPLGSLFLAVFTHLICRNNLDLVDYGAAIDNNSTTPTVARPFSGYQLLMGPRLIDNQGDVRFAAEGIYTGTYTINGYSPLEHVGFAPRIHGHVWGEMADAGGMDFLFEREPTTNRSRLSLMRVNRLLIYNPYLDHAQPLLGKDWIPTATGDLATLVDRQLVGGRVQHA